MKNYKLIFMVIITTLTSIYSFGQEYEIERKMTTGIFEIPDKSKSDLFSSINKWISINYNSAMNVIQMNDKESGTIIIKGINEIEYKNSMKAVYPKNKYIPEYTTTKFNHLIEINVKENKYRIIYKITDIASEDAGYNTMIFQCIDLNGSNEKSIEEYNRLLEKSLKKAMVGKKKREIYKSQTKQMIEEINTNLLNDIKQTLRSIKQSTIESSNDNW